MKVTIEADVKCTSFRFDDFSNFDIFLYDKYLDSDTWWMFGWFSENPDKSYDIDLPSNDNLKHMWE